MIWSLSLGSVPGTQPVKFLQVRATQGMLQWSVAVGGRPPTHAASSGAASFCFIKKRGIAMGIEMNFASASPRVVLVGAMKITAFAPSRGAFIHSAAQLKSTITM